MSVLASIQAVRDQLNADIVANGSQDITGTLLNQNLIDFLDTVEAKLVASYNGRVGAVTPETNDYTWAQLDKTVSDLADLATKSHTDLSDIGTNTHAQIDTHIADTANPHATDIGNIGSGTLAELNTAITDATINAAATTSTAGIQENATTAEVTTGTATDRTITPDALNGSTVELESLTTTGNIIAEGQAYSEMNTLTDAATIATDCDNGNVHEVTLTDNRTLGAPTNLKDGATYIWIITQDGSGSRTLAYNAVFKFPGGTAPTLTTAASSVDILTGVSDGTNIYCTMQNDFS